MSSELEHIPERVYRILLDDTPRLFGPCRRCLEIREVRTLSVHLRSDAGSWQRYRCRSDFIVLHLFFAKFHHVGRKNVLGCAG